MGVGSLGWRGRRSRVGLAVVAALSSLALVAAIVIISTTDPASWEPAPKRSAGLTMLAGTDDQRFELYTAGGHRDFLPGVNLGATIPGHAPGEVAIRREDVRRWLPMIADLGLRVIRIYTILPPHFYEEVRAYNLAHPDAPLYLMHGVWIPEARFLETQDLFDDQVRTGFRDELSRAVDVVHGTAELAPRPGHAHGTYTADVSAWTFAWAIGVEWDPEATYASDRRNGHQPRFEGSYFVAAEQASPTESWLAEMLDHLAAELADRGATVPLTFNNWPTTDPLEHPEEPLPVEDLVGVDANHVLPTDAWPGGTFASYHAYPYYPDFQRYEPGIADHVHDGRRDPYAGYLTKLRDHHAEMPLMITEFGVPSSLGSAHDGPVGRDQGGHTESEQIATNAELLRIIAGLDLAGGLVFAWTDEWFKLTWNTMDLEIPAARRPLWKNVWTNEQHFGLLAHDPGPQPRYLVGADADAWIEPSQAILESRDAVREVRATHDEGYLYLRVVLDDPDRRDELVVGFDLHPGSDAVSVSGGDDPAADVAVRFPRQGDAQAVIRARRDPHAWIYGGVLGYLEVDAAALRSDPDAWRPQRLMTNRPYPHPVTGELLPAEEQEIGRLRHGVTDPEDPAGDTLAMWHEDAEAITMRLPWATVGFADPSSRQAWVVAEDGSVSTRTVERLGISVALGDHLARTQGYAWPDWNEPTWHERPKAGLERLAETVVEVTR